jgi:hypothetical protein
MLHELQTRDRRVFEYWWHAAAYLPMCDYRYALPRMRAHAESARTREFLKTHKPLVKEVLARIRKEGPQGSSHFDAPSGKKRGSWWDWKPAKRVLETLFSSGTLMVAGRENFQRLYDLTERVLPPDVDTKEPTREEWIRYLLRRILAGQGISSLKYWWMRDKKALAFGLSDLIQSGEVTTVSIAADEGGPLYALTKAVAAAERAASVPEQVHILSPFDGLVIWRNELRRVFDFEYRLECYYPESRREFGYFCLPILWGDQFIGRIDAKADREAGVLLVRKVVFEHNKSLRQALPLLADKLHAFAAFNGCNRLVIESVVPPRVLPELREKAKKK